MLLNGLGELLSREAATARRFVDLFTGSGVVATYVAWRYPIPVLAFDLQTYSIVLTEAVLGRRGALRWESVWDRWSDGARAWLIHKRVPTAARINRRIVDCFREWCAAQEEAPITRAYGGHYFGPKQAIDIDALRVALPMALPERTVALAALIQAASQCAAAPGHTAQPFQPTRTAKPFLEESWEKDVFERVRLCFGAISGQFACRRGHARMGDANQAARKLLDGDLVFIDPPYSGVHYSRFYHVLETIARGGFVEVSGIGRYPPPNNRPRSSYSLRSESLGAFDDLLQTVAYRGAKAIVTFPGHVCSNGLSGEIVCDTARKYFRVREMRVASRFSTLGGTGNKKNGEVHRAARQQADELMLVLDPK